LKVRLKEHCEGIMRVVRRKRKKRRTEGEVN
jgi:hypothetical protein